MGNLLALLVVTLVLNWNVPCECTDGFVVNSNDWITILHVTNLLKTKGIGIAKTYTGPLILIPQGDVELAKAVLNADIKKRHYDIEVSDTVWVRPSRMKRYVKRRTLIRLLTSASHKVPSQLIDSLRAPFIKAQSEKYPFVSELRACARDYIDENGKSRIGFECELELQSQQKKAGVQLWYQVWNDGKDVKRRALREWTGKDETVSVARDEDPDYFGG